MRERPSSSARPRCCSACWSPRAALRRAPTDSDDDDTGILDASRSPRTAARIAALAPEIPEREPFLPPTAERTADGERIIRDDARPALFGFDWLTNFGIRIVRFDEFNPRLLRDEIVPLTNPQYITLTEAQTIYVDGSPMIFLEVNGDARAYPLEILLWHEIVNDVVGGVPVLMTYCPLCNTAIAFERQVGARTLLFGGSGILRNSDLVMYDRETESLWQQIGGKALVGDMVGATLTPLPAPIISFGQLRDAFPNALVLSRDTGTPIAYGGTPYTAYDAVDDRGDYRRSIRRRGGPAAAVRGTGRGGAHRRGGSRLSVAAADGASGGGGRRGGAAHRRVLDARDALRARSAADR